MADICKHRKWNLEDVEKHVESQLYNRSVTAVDGSNVDLPLKHYPVSVCCHSDSPGCLEIVATTRRICDKFNRDEGYI